jgi:hypothetical protein
MSAKKACHAEKRKIIEMIKSSFHFFFADYIEHRKHREYCQMVDKKCQFFHRSLNFCFSLIDADYIHPRHLQNIVKRTYDMTFDLTIMLLNYCL